jgi:hypothetical protein
MLHPSSTYNNQWIPTRRRIWPPHGLVAITSLGLQGRCHECALSSIKAFLQNFQTITTLELYEGSFLAFDDIPSIVGALPRLQRLRLTRLRCHNLYIPGPYNKPPIFYLQELDIDLLVCGHVSRWLLSYDRFPPIKRLKLAFSLSGDDIGPLLRAFGPTLEHPALQDIRSMSHTFVPSLTPL